MTEYYLCEFEYGYEGQFYQIITNNELNGYCDLDGNSLILEGDYGYKMIYNTPIIPSWLNN